MRNAFARFAHWTANATGTPAAFLLASLSVVVWAGSGPLFHYSDTWQLVINTSTTVLTFLMIFLVQATQNRDAKASHVKLDALLKANERISNALLGLEDATDERLEAAAQAVRKEGGGG